MAASMLAKVFSRLRTNRSIISSLREVACLSVLPCRANFRQLSSAQSAGSSSDGSDSSDDEATVKRKKSLKLARPGKRAAEDRKRQVEDMRAQVRAAEEGVDPELQQAAEAAAASLGGDTSQTASDLLQRLRRGPQDVTSQAGDKPAQQVDFGDLFAGMKMEKKKSARPRSSGGGDAGAQGGRPANLGPRKGQTVRLFSGPDLGVFPAPPASPPHTARDLLEDEESWSDLWRRLEEREVRRLVTPLPANPFLEAVEWTRQGKLWTFPVDNEADLGEEASVEFHQHVFLDPHLSGFPAEGPIRRFMELVVLGLSRNPHLTLVEKVQHIDWYRGYFEDKVDLARMEDGGQGEVGSLAA